MELKDVFIKLDKNQAEEKESSLFLVVKGTLESYYEVKESQVKGVYVIKASNEAFLNVPRYLQEELDKPDGIIKLISKEEYLNLLHVNKVIRRCKGCTHFKKMCCENHMIVGRCKLYKRGSSRYADGYACEFFSPKM